MLRRERCNPEWSGVIVKLIVVFGLMFLIFPIIVVIVTSFNKTAYIQFPPESLSLKWYLNILQKYKFIDGFKISLLIASIVTAISTASGIMAALALVRYNLKGKKLIESYLLSPIILPEVVTGVCLLTFFSSMGMFNNILNLIIGHIIITIPYVIRTVAAVLYRFNRSIEEAAMNLGANPVQTFFKVTFPLIKPGVVAGALFAFIMSFDNFAVSIFLTGPRTETLPIVIFMHLRYETDPTLAAVCTLLIIGIAAVVFFLERFISLEQFAGIE
jgi:putative spermidine/putrescine transport system permease protein